MRHRALWTTSLAALLFLAIVSPAQGAVVQPQFQVRCLTSHVAQVDPIVSPGQVSAHQHEFFGNTSTNADSTYASMIAATTTCSTSKDTAGYWVPTLIAPDGSVIRAIGVKVYYRGQAGQVTVAFPPDLRMVSHNAYVSPVDPDNLIIKFPGCAELDAGGNIVTDSPDHISHMADAVHQVCPPDHPIRVPTVTIVVGYRVPIPGNMLSSDIAVGAPPLSTMHADFWSTWVPGGLEALTARCLNGTTNCGKIVG